MVLRIQDFYRSWEEEVEKFAPNNFSRVSAREVLGEWDHIIDTARDLVASFEEVATNRPVRSAGSNEPRVVAPPFSPAPIAIARRRLANETVAARRIRSCAGPRTNHYRARRRGHAFDVALP